MALNYIWVGFFLIAFIAALTKSIFFGDWGVFERIMNGTFTMAKVSVMDIALPLTGTMILWLGLMNVGQKAGAINFLARIIGPFFEKLFPEIPKDHPVNGELVMNFSANMLGLDNAATPLGLKAMKSLQELNPNKDSASNAQIMFLALNTSGLTIMPIAIMTQRAILGAANPTDIFIPLLLSTFASTIIAILYVGIRQGLDLTNKIVMTTLLSAIAFIAASIAIFWALGNGAQWNIDFFRIHYTITKETIVIVSKVASNFVLFSIIIAFLGVALFKRINVYEAFIDGAKDGFHTSVKVMPYLVGMLVAIGVMRDSGALNFMLDIVKFSLGWLNDTRFVDALPTAIIKPLSGSGAKAIMIETMTTYGVDSFPGKLSCLFQGAADTTFYIIALYFGSVGIKKTRYAVSAGLVADIGGAIAAIFIAYAFFS